MEMYCYFGHHKCATGWITNVIKDICNLAGWRETVIYDASVSCIDQTLSSYLKKEKIKFFSYTNADIAQVDTLQDYKGFHVIRDPRDIIVSAYFSHLHSHTVEGWPELVVHREKLQKMDRDDGLILEMEFIKPFLDLMDRWDYENENILEIKMEELTTEPEKVFLNIFQFLGILSEEKPTLFDEIIMAINPLNQKGRGTLPFGLPVSPIRFSLEHVPKEKVLGVLERNAFSRLSGGRKSGEENLSSHYRKGQAGDWKNHFKPHHNQYFSSQFDGLLEKLGYE
jgi:hypothetical protein